MLGAWGATSWRRSTRRPSSPAEPLTVRQIPLAVVMVALTTLTLWSLGQAIVVTPPANAPRRLRSDPPPGRRRPASADRAPGPTRRATGPSGQRSAIAGSSASAAATAVSIAVRQRIPPAVAAWRISAASRTAPERGVGVLTTRRTSPLAMSSRIGDLAARPESAPRRASPPAGASYPAAASARRVPGVAASR